MIQKYNEWLPNYFKEYEWMIDYMDIYIWKFSVIKAKYNIKHKYYIYCPKYIHITKDWKIQKKVCIWFS